jgi:hypothetical protein
MGPKLPAILTFRIQMQNGRRRRNWRFEPERLIFTSLIGPLILLSGIAVRKLVLAYLPADFPRPLAILGMIAVVVMIGVIQQLRFLVDRAWHRFVATQPISRRDRMIVQIHSGWLPTFIGLTLACFGFSAIGVSFWGLSGAVNLCLIVLLFPALLVIQCVVSGILFIPLAPREYGRLLGTKRIAALRHSPAGERCRPRGAQILLEFLRMLRGRWTRLVTCVSFSLLAVFALRAFGRHAGIAAITAFAMCAIGERANLLLNRSGNQLYNSFGTDGADYILGVTISSGLAVLVACIIQLPLLYRDRADIASMATAACICAGISFSTLARLLAFDAAGGTPKDVNDLLTAGVVGTAYTKQLLLSGGLFILRMGIIRLPALVIGTAMATAATYVSAVVPLIAAIIAVPLETSLCSRRQIAQHYWRRVG